jgi:hypothetical protein
MLVPMKQTSKMEKRLSTNQGGGDEANVIVGVAERHDVRDCHMARPQRKYRNIKPGQIFYYYLNVKVPMVCLFTGQTLISPLSPLFKVHGKISKLTCVVRDNTYVFTSFGFLFQSSSHKVSCQTCYFLLIFHRHRRWIKGKFHKVPKYIRPRTKTNIAEAVALIEERLGSSFKETL